MLYLSSLFGTSAAAAVHQYQYIQVLPQLNYKMAYHAIGAEEDMSSEVMELSTVKVAHVLRFVLYITSVLGFKDFLFLKTTRKLS